MLKELFIVIVLKMAYVEKSIIGHCRKEKVHI